MADEITKDKKLEETADAAPAPKRRGRPPKAKPQPPIETDTKEAEVAEAKDEVAEAKDESESVEAEAAKANDEVKSESDSEGDTVEADSTTDAIDTPLDAENIPEASEAVADVPDAEVSTELDIEAENCNTADSEPKLQILLTPSIPLYRGPADKFRIKGASGVATVLGTEGEFTKIEYLRRGLGKQIGYVKIYE